MIGQTLLNTHTNFQGFWSNFFFTRPADRAGRESTSLIASQQTHARASRFPAAPTAAAYQTQPSHTAAPIFRHTVPVPSTYRPHTVPYRPIPSHTTLCSSRSMASSMAPYRKQYRAIPVWIEYWSSLSHTQAVLIATFCHGWRHWWRLQVWIVFMIELEDAHIVLKDRSCKNKSIYLQLELEGPNWMHFNDRLATNFERQQVERERCNFLVGVQ